MAGHSALQRRPSISIEERTSPSTPICRSEEHTSELQSHHDLVCRLLLEKKKDLAHPLGLAVHIAGDASQTAPVSLPFATLYPGSALYVYGATLVELLHQPLPVSSTVYVN